MADPLLTFAAFVYWFVPAFLIILVIGYAAYAAHSLSVARAEQALRPKPVGPEPAGELRRLNAETVNALADGRATLEKARETLRRGIKG